MYNMTQPLLNIRGLTLRRGSFLLDHIDLTLKSSEILAILGKTGSGKTLLLESSAGFYPPDDGQILYQGKEAHAQPIHQRNIGYLYQDYSLFPHMTAYDNIAYGLKMQKQPANMIRRQVEHMALRFGIFHILDQYPATLSGGEQQRVALARALITRPSLLLLDEPFSALDPVTKESMYQLLREIREDFQCSVLFVTHNFTEAQQLADRIAILSDGRLWGVVPSDELYTRDWPGNVRQFLGMESSTL